MNRCAACSAWLAVSACVIVLREAARILAAAWQCGSSIRLSFLHSFGDAGSSRRSLASSNPRRQNASMSNTLAKHTTLPAAIGSRDACSCVFACVAPLALPRPGPLPLLQRRALDGGPTRVLRPTFGTQGARTVYRSCSCRLSVRRLPRVPGKPGRRALLEEEVVVPCAATASDKSPRESRESPT